MGRTRKKRRRGAKQRPSGPLAKLKKQPAGPTGTRYTKEFKAAAIQLARESSMSVPEVARHLGLEPRTLERWVHQAEVDEGRGGPGELTSAEKEELRRLRRENRELRVIAEILKKAQAFCDKDPS